MQLVFTHQFPEHAVGIGEQAERSHGFKMPALFVDGQPAVATGIFKRVNTIAVLRVFLAKVVRGPQPLDLHALKQACGKFRGAFAVGDGMYIAQELLPLPACIEPGKMVHHAVLQHLGLAHVNDLALFVVKIIHAGCIGQLVHLRTVEVGRQYLVAVFFFQEFTDQFVAALRQYLFKQDGRCVGITAGAVPVADGNVQRPADMPQPVFVPAREGLAAEFQCTELAGIPVIAMFAQVVLDKGVIEIDVVRHENAVGQQAVYFMRHINEWCGTGHHGIGNARELGHIGRYGMTGIDEGFKTLLHLLPVVQHNGDLGDAITFGMAAGGLYINNSIHDSAWQATVFWAIPVGCGGQSFTSLRRHEPRGQIFVIQAECTIPLHDNFKHMTNTAQVQQLVQSVNDAGLQRIGDMILAGQRISFDDGVYLFEKGSPGYLGALANWVREQRHGNKTYFNRNFHIEPTNVCVFSCAFCSYSRLYAHREEGWELSIDQMVDMVKKYDGQPITEVHIVGGVHPKMTIDFFAELLRRIKAHRPDLHVKAFTAVEFDYMFRKAKLSVNEGMRLLQQAGLDSIPGGGAEIFHPDIRQQICADKVDAEGWLSIHRTAHKMGIHSNATLLYGHIEQYWHRVDHMERLRQLQDETGGFNTFIPLKFRNKDNDMSHVPESTIVEDMKMYAVSRLYMDNFPHLKAYWPMLGRQNAQLTLSFGVNDLDGTIDDSTKIYSMAGSEEQSPTLTTAQLVQLIKQAGREPVERDTLYNEIRNYSTMPEAGVNQLYN